MGEDELAALARQYTTIAAGPWGIPADWTIVRLAEELLALRAEVERLRGLVGEPDRNPAPHTPLRAFVGILPEAGR
jgi:hypothetical protein